MLIQRGSGEAGKRVRLDENEIQHLRVRRARDRERVEVLDGAGLRGIGSLVQDGREWMVEVEAVERTLRPPETTLAVAAGDRERFSWMVEKSVELGVTRILPLETARTAGVSTRLKDPHLDRLRRSALEAIKQSGVTWVPSIESPLRLEELLRREQSGAAWLADSQGEPAPASLDQGPLTVLVGPEGGLTPDEIALATAAGFQPTALGPHTLRFETAALAAAAVIAQARLRGQHG
ncbi:MAG TPA: RsmE family RNA methyltransferase [Gemmatimonadales bacterium]|nr:RsmE family RNA methyltransferase [Gemmatimonadales bacterium]